MSVLDDFRAECEATLTELKATYLLPHCKLTLVMRNPQSDDGDLVITADEIGDVIGALERLRDREDEDRFLAEAASHCSCCERCAIVPCPGVAAGGPCDHYCHCDDAHLDEQGEW